MQQSVQKNNLSWVTLWRGLTKLDFISNFFTWAMELLARVTEPLASLSAIYIIICAGVPTLLAGHLYTLALALIIGSPELLVVGAFKIASRELAAGNKKAWWLMLSCFALLLLTALTVGDLFMWHWHQDAVNVLMGCRCLAGIAYTFTRGITTDQGERVNVQPGSPVNLLLAEFTASIQETVNQVNQVMVAEVNQIRQGLLSEVNHQHQQFVTEVHTALQAFGQQQQYLTTTVNGLHRGIQDDMQAAIEELARQSHVSLETAVERLERANSRRLEGVYTRLEQVRVTLESNPSLPAINGAHTTVGSPLRLPSRVPSQTSERVHTSTVNPLGEPDGLEGTKVHQGLLFTVNHYRTHQIMPTLATIMAATACGKTLASKIKNRAEAELGLKTSNED